MTDEIVIKQLKVLIDYGKVNEIQGIIDVANNAITAIERLTRERDELRKDFGELDMENYVMLRDMNQLAITHKPCVICRNMKCEYRDTEAERRCDDIMWREVCEENSGGMTEVEKREQQQMIERLTLERDAAVCAMETMVRDSIPCDFCLPENRNCHGEPLEDDGCHCDRFVWRGVREENCGGGQ